VSATGLKRIGLPARYEVLAQIASGQMASVWCAYDTALGHKVAIKVLAPQFAGDERAVRRFEHEARRAAHLSAHPHVVMIYDVAETAGRPYIVMEHLAGGTVADAFRVGAVRREEALRWLAEAASALDYAHARGVVHGGIKPGNLLLSLDRAVHVTDFGLTPLPNDAVLLGTDRRLDTDQRLSVDQRLGVDQRPGAAAYISPEQALGAPASDASDRYAYAVAAFELLVGQLPFTAEDSAGMARRHIADDPPQASTRNRALPPAVDAVFARGMAKRPEDRWSTASAFVGALDAACSEPGPARRFTAPPARRSSAAPARRSTVAAPLRPRRRPKRPRRRAAIAALAAAGVAVGIVVAVSHGGTAPHEPITQARLSPPAPRRSHPRSANPKPVAAPGAAASSTSSSSGAPSTSSSSGAPSTSSSSGAPGTNGATPAEPGASTGPVGASTNDTTHSASTTNTSPPAPIATTTAPAGPHTTATSATPPPPQPASAAALEARGHDLMLEGAYSAAIPVLRQAISVASPRDVNYAYALFDLGHSLRLAGDPAAAIPILERRLQIRNQTPVVLSELRLAQRAEVRRGGAAGTATASPRRRDHAPRPHDGGATIRATGG
jgi:serine/threonine protein kinase